MWYFKGSLSPCSGYNMGQKSLKRIKKYNGMVGASWRNKEDKKMYKNMSWVERTKFNYELKKFI
jgi:hypothetical protein